MTTRRLIIGFFVIYAILIPVLAWKFVAQNPSAATAMMGSALIIALMFWSKRAPFINLIISIYVFQNYLTRPYISLFEAGLSLEGLRYIQNLRSYDTPEAAAVVYWSLFSLLLAWLIGLLAFRTPRNDRLFFIPRMFRTLDLILQKNRLPFIFSIGLLFVLNFTSPGTGLRATVTGEGKALFLFGLASLSTISVVCLFAFLKSQHDGLRSRQYLLLLPVLLQILSRLLAGGRSALFHIAVAGLVYWLFLQYEKRWRPQRLIMAGLLSSMLIAVTLFAGLFAQVLRPLYRYSESVDVVDILNTLDYETVVRTKEILLLGITELLYRLSALKAQFYILNDWYIHEPLQYYNPLAATMRIVNDLVPGTIFPNLLTINQLFEYVYYDQAVFYSSEMWSIQGTLYLYSGHFVAPLVVLFLAVIANRVYPSLKRSLKASPAFAAFFVLLALDVLTNGTAERIIPVDVVRPLASFLIFVVVYKSFSLILPTRIKL